MQRRSPRGREREGRREDESIIRALEAWPPRPRYRPPPPLTGQGRPAATASPHIIHCKVTYALSAPIHGLRSNDMTIPILNPTHYEHDL